MKKYSIIYQNPWMVFPDYYINPDEPLIHNAYDQRVFFSFDDALHNLMCLIHLWNIDHCKIIERQGYY